MASNSPIGGVGPAILLVLWIQVGIAITLVTIRGFVASRKNNKWRWDFIWSFLALMTAIAAACFATKAVSMGLGNHFRNLSLGDDLSVLRWNYYAFYIAVVSIACSKFSVTALMLDVQQGTQYKIGRIVLWSVAGIVTVVTLLEIFLTAFQCRPVDHVWDIVGPGSCPIQDQARTIGYIHAIIGGVTDIFLALYPISIASNLQTSMRVKVGFCLLMMVGIVPGIASFIRFGLLHTIYNAKDFTYAEGLFDIWASVEIGSLVILGCIPPLRPFFLRIVYGKSKGSSSNGYGSTSRGPIRSIARPDGSVSAMPLSEPKNDGIIVQYTTAVEDESAF